MYTASTPIFDGVDAHLAPGFHVLDANGDEIVYLFTWAAGKGADMSTHNHGRPPKPTAPAFAEVHWVMHNGTGRGGMYTTPEPGSDQRDRTVVRQGEEHGPFFNFDPATGAPMLRENGAVEYPWHSWEAGTDDLPGQCYDVVAAFEITAPYANVLA
jgi:Aldos-2-ulose dehydratase/isomerase (AUDH) Cupin domain